MAGVCVCGDIIKYLIPQNNVGLLRPLFFGRYSELQNKGSMTHPYRASLICDSKLA